MNKTTVDARGLSCPEPVIKAKQFIESTEEKPQSLTVIVDNDTACKNVKKLAAAMGYHADSIEKPESFYIEFELTDPAAGSAASSASTPSSASARSASVSATAAGAISEGGSGSAVATSSGSAAAFLDSPSKNTVLLFTSDSLGDERELGKTLMRSLLYTISVSDPLPQAVCFLNSGVFVPTEESQALESLIGKGVKILCCGACLNFFELTNKKLTGEVSNMYEIYDVLNAAEKVIKF